MGAAEPRINRANCQRLVQQPMPAVRRGGVLPGRYSGVGKLLGLRNPQAPQGKGAADCRIVVTGAVADCNGAASAGDFLTRCSLRRRLARR